MCSVLWCNYATELALTVHTRGSYAHLPERIHADTITEIAILADFAIPQKVYRACIPAAPAAPTQNAADPELLLVSFGGAEAGGTV